jgi:hypothetical protein
MKEYMYTILRQNKDKKYETPEFQFTSEDKKGVSNLAKLLNKKKKDDSFKYVAVKM